MTEQESRAVLTLALMAAFVDGMKDDREREAVKRVADALGEGTGVDLAAVYRDVLMGKPDLAANAAALQSPEARQLAYEMAVGVCDADGARGVEETKFLASLAAALQLPASAAESFAEQADEIARAGEVGPAVAPAVAAGATPAAPAATVSGPVLGKASLSDAEMDKTILNASITNAALELLPESLASMAILPLQMRLVYRIGQSYGYQLDRGHVKEFVATLGVGLTGQYLEQFGRKLFGGLLGGIAGGLGRSVGRQAVSSGLSFATTYALGRVAQRYYAGGRTLDTTALKSTFDSLLVEAKSLAPKYKAEIEQKSRTINTGELVAMVKGDKALG